jgi:chitinase
MVGISTFGKVYTLKEPEVGYIGAEVAGPGHPGKYTHSPGFLGYNEICELTLEGGWTTRFLTMNAMKISFKLDQWVSYEDAVTVSQKANYVKDNHLGGVMFWTIDTDDFHGNCYNLAYPLVLSANNVFGYNNSVDRAQRFHGIVESFYL